MSPHGFSRTAEELSAARSEALRGAAVGAAKFGIATAFLGLCGTLFSPIYRSLTIQFKVYLQVSGMTLGGWIEADKRFRAWENMRVMEKRRLKALERDEGVWREWEKMVEEEVNGKGNGGEKQTGVR
ncbi:MAG: hypothetical protein L6R38_006832 [Xanthoria sp. 2 TBL-2021]|nr:MAG: hypothetical protein L6R38_006832 [Xanthoria sp. 2 TBL-2021]